MLFTILNDPQTPQSMNHDHLRVTMGAPYEVPRQHAVSGPPTNKPAAHAKRNAMQHPSPTPGHAAIHHTLVGRLLESVRKTQFVPQPCHRQIEPNSLSSNLNGVPWFFCACAATKQTRRMMSSSECFLLRQIQSLTWVAGWAF